MCQLKRPLTLTVLNIDIDDDSGAYRLPTPAQHELFQSRYISVSDPSTPALGPESTLLEQLLELIDSLQGFHTPTQGEFTTCGIPPFSLPHPLNQVFLGSLHGLSEYSGTSSNHRIAGDFHSTISDEEIVADIMYLMHGRETFSTINPRPLNHPHELPQLSAISEPGSGLARSELPELLSDLDLHDPSPPEGSLNTDVTHDFCLWRLMDEGWKGNLDREESLLNIDDVLHGP